MVKAISYLDLNVVELYCFQDTLETHSIDAIMRGIELGDDIPPVHVIKVSAGQYELTLNGTNDDENVGGHHRAVAHYLANEPLPAIIESDHGLFCIHCRYFVGEITFYDNFNEYQIRKQLSFYR